LSGCGAGAGGHPDRLFWPSATWRDEAGGWGCEFAISRFLGTGLTATGYSELVLGESAAKF